MKPEYQATIDKSKELCKLADETLQDAKEALNAYEEERTEIVTDANAKMAEIEALHASMQ